MSQHTVISLYTGAGGLDLGLEAAGFKNLLAVEMEPIAVKTLEANEARWGKIFDKAIENFVVPGGEVEEPDASKLLDPAGIRPKQATLLAGGPPCQPFSKSGYWARGDSARLNDPRALTLDRYLDVLECALPEVFLLENVPGISFSDKDEGLSYVQQRVARINERHPDANYSFEATKLNAAEFGVPQLRERVFVIGHRGGKIFKFPERGTHALPPPVDMASGETPSLQGYEVPTGLEPASRAWDALGHYDVARQFDDDPELRMRGKWAPVLPTIPEGANYLWHTPRGGSGLNIWGWRTRYWSMLLKLAKNRPSWTLTATPGPAIGPFHWKSRRLHCRELAALQTFPRSYVIVGNNRQAHLQLGNAVPSALAELLGYEIRRQFFQESVPKAPTLLPERRHDLPAPESPAPVSSLPDWILDLHGDHAAHRGTGKGRGAVERQRRLASAR